MALEKIRTPNPNIELSDDAMIIAALNLRATLHRSFYLLLLLSCFSLYLIYEQISRSQDEITEASFTQASDAIKEVLQIYRFLFENVQVSSAYRSFTSSSFGTFGTMDMLDLENQPLSNLEYFALQRVYYTPGIGIADNTIYGQPLYSLLIRFAEIKGFLPLKLKLEKLYKNYDRAKIIGSFGYLKRACATLPKYEKCTPNDIDKLHVELFEGQTTKTRTVTSDIFPVGVEKQLLLRLTPIILLVVLCQFISHELRWREFVCRARTQHKWQSTAGRWVLWAVTDSLSLRLLSGNKPSELFRGYIMYSFSVAVVIVLPIATQLAILCINYNRDGFNWSDPWNLIASATVISSSIALMSLRRRERGTESKS